MKRKVLLFGFFFLFFVSSVSAQIIQWGYIDDNFDSAFTLGYMDYWFFSMLGNSQYVNLTLNNTGEGNATINYIEEWNSKDSVWEYAGKESVLLNFGASFNHTLRFHFLKDARVGQLNVDLIPCFNGECDYGQAWWNNTWNKRANITLTNDNDDITHKGELIGYPYGINITNLIIHSNASKELRLTDSGDNEIENFDVWNYNVGDGNGWATITFLVNNTVAAGNSVYYWLYYDNESEVQAPSYDGLLSFDKSYADGWWENCNGTAGTSSLMDSDPYNWNGSSNYYATIETVGDGTCENTKVVNKYDGQRLEQEGTHRHLFVASQKNHGVLINNRVGMGVYINAGYFSNMLVRDGDSAMFAYLNYDNVVNDSMTKIKPEPEWNVLSYNHNDVSPYCGYVNGERIGCLTTYGSNEGSLNIIHSQNTGSYYDQDVYWDDIIIYNVQNGWGNTGFRAYGLGNESTILTETTITTSTSTSSTTSTPETTITTSTSTSTPETTTTISNQTCLLVHSAGEEFYQVGVCTLNDSFSVECVYVNASQYACVDKTKDIMVKLLPISYGFLGSGWIFDLGFDATFWLGVVGLVIMLSIFLMLSWGVLKVLRY